MTTMFRSVRGLWVVLAAICIISLVLSIRASLSESAIMDELAHIPAGYGYVRYLDHRLNPEHPPLVKALAGLPLLFAGMKFPTEHTSWQKDVNGQWDAGTQFLYFSGNDADRLVQLARIGPLLLTLLFVVLIFTWSAELIGRRWAFLPTTLFALSPHVLAHGHYVTTDIAAAFGIVLGTYFFVRLLYSPTRSNLLMAGLAFGVAQLGKFSAVLLGPYFLFLAGVFALAHTARTTRELPTMSRIGRGFLEMFRGISRTIAVFVIGYLIVVYPVYTLFTVNYPAEKQLADTTFILTSFGGGPTPADEFCKPARCLADLNIGMIKNELTRPFAEYFLGILMVLQRSAGGNTNYFLDEVSAAGWHLYFPVVYLIKEPLPVVILVITALIAGLWGIVKTAVRDKRYAIRRLSDWLGVNFTEFAMIVFVVFYWAWSIKSPLNIGFRHLFPTLPFIYILTTEFWKGFITRLRIQPSFSFFALLWQGVRAVFVSSAKYLVFIFLVGWFLLEVLIATPHYLSYFNELGGGPRFGYRFVTDSNYDWGQDLLRLKHFVAARPEIRKIGVDYFGGGNPKYYLGDCSKNSHGPIRIAGAQAEAGYSCAENWWSARGNPAKEGIHWLAVSVNTLQGATQKASSGFKRKPEDEYRWLTELRPPKPGMGNVPEPDYRVGTSIFVYKL